MGFDGGAGAMKLRGNGRENMSLWWGTHPPYFGINAGGPIYRGILGHISRDNNGEMAPKYAPGSKKCTVGKFCIFGPITFHTSNGPSHHIVGSHKSMVAGRK